MQKLILLTVVIAITSGCAHRELRAPCAAATLAATNHVPCDQPLPVNFAAVQSERYVASELAL